VFLTGRAAGRRMMKQRGGVILTINAPAGHEALAAGFGPACASVLTISRTLAAELGPCGVRVLCLQPNAVPESAALLRSARQQAVGANLPCDEHLSSMARATLLGRHPTLDEVANVAAFIASDRASGMTGTTVKINCGAQVD
jgi:3-oxoacyl-[acyl-carrier protein] reductase